MQENHPTLQDARISSLLREARMCPPLPTRFQEQVWRRIEDAEAPAKAGSWLDALAGLILRPRFVLAAAMVLLAAGGFAGLREGRQVARQDAQMNYFAAVAPQIAR